MSADKVTALGLAMKQEKWDIACFFVEKGADPNAQCVYIYSMRTLFSIFKLTNLVELLEGSRVNALQYAAGWGSLEIICLLVENYANPNARGMY